MSELEKKNNVTKEPYLSVKLRSEGQVCVLTLFSMGYFKTLQYGGGGGGGGIMPPLTSLFLAQS